MFLPLRVALSLALVWLLAVPAGADDGVEDQTRVQVAKEQRGDDVVVRARYGSSDIRDWRAVDNSTLIVDTYSRGELVATFTQPCLGIDSAETLGFTTMGPFELDQSTKVILPNGFRCQFESLRQRQSTDQEDGDGGS